MTSMRPIGAVFARASAVATACFVLACGSAAAAVKDAGYGVTLNRSVAVQHRGGETLHAARIDRRAFEAAAAAGRTLELPGKDGAPQVARFARVESSGGNWSWIGHVDTALGEQTVVVTFGPDAVFGTLPQKHGQPLRIESIRGHSWLIEGQPQRERGDDVAIPRELRDPATLKRMQQAYANRKTRITPQTVTMPTIDVLMLYTPSMVTRYGSASAVTTRLTHLASVMNGVFYDSPVLAQLRIVGMKQIDYTTAGNNAALLDLITNPSSNPVKTQVDAWRNQYGADLVSVVRSYDSATQENCGLAWIGGYHETEFVEGTGYSVVGDGSSGGYYCDDLSFSHEIGHNMGGGHDYATAGGDYGHETDSRGYRKTLPDGTGFATVMAYPAAKDVHLGRFSNYKLALCMANYCGDSETADMVGTVKYSAMDVASYRGGTQFWGIEPRMTITASTPSIVEGNSGTRQAWFHVALEEASPNPVYFELDAFSFSSWEGGADFVKPVPGTVLTIPPGSLSTDVAITVLGDTVAENNEYVTVSLKNVSGASPSSSTGFTIVNDDVGLSLADASVTEGDSGTKAMTFTVTLSAASTTPIGFDFRASGGIGLATDNVDFVPVTTHVDVPAGVTTKTVTVTIIGDTVAEYDEALIASLSNAVGASITRSMATGTIVNDDPPALRIADATVVEGNSGTAAMNFVVSLSMPATTPVTFDLATITPTGTTATANADFVPASVHLQMPVGTYSKTFTVAVKGDLAVEGDEFLFASVTNVVGATIADGVGRGTILNDDLPTLSLLSDVSIAEGDSGIKYAVFTATLSQATDHVVTFDYGTWGFNEPGAQSDTDYVYLYSTPTSIPAGQLSKTFSIAINGDTLLEGNEKFPVSISNIQGALLGTGTRPPLTSGIATATGWILNDDPPAISISDATITEGNSGTQLLSFNIKLSSPTAVPVYFDFATVPTGTATAGVDYAARTLTNVGIPAGQTSTTLKVNIIGDGMSEDNETFGVKLSNVRGATVADGDGIGAILNDDPLVWRIANATLIEGNSGTRQMSFVASLSSAAYADLSITAATYDTPNATAKPGTDYTPISKVITVPKGLKSVAFTVPILTDTVAEPNEVFIVTLSNPTDGLTIATGAASGTITNDD